MTYYDDAKNVEEYIQMAEGYDGQLLIDILRGHLADESTVLELGMGPGKDLLLLAEHFTVTGSDRSPVFVERFRKAQPNADVIQLDALTMAGLPAERQFDGIYSNKVLYHLTPDQLTAAFPRQAAALKPGGIALHSFWAGEGEEDMHGLHFAYYTADTLRAAVGREYEVLRLDTYAEMDPDDSLVIVLKKRG
ncbi:class I SAM-dependent methyltransferase [Chloroflexota bacterium]